MTDEFEIVPMEAEVVALYERYNEVSQDFTLAQMAQAMGILLYQMTEGDKALIMEGINRIASTALSIQVETVN